MNVSEFLQDLAEKLKNSESAVVVIEVDGTDARLFSNVSEEEADALMLECIMGAIDAPLLH